MNYQDLIEKLFIETGYPDTGNTRFDYMLQKYKDALNAAQDEIASTCAPFLDHLVREDTLSVVANTQDYLLGDWVQRPLSMWTDDCFAHKVKFRRPSIADRDGSRNTVLVPYVFGPFQLTLLPRTTMAALGNIAGSTTGAQASEGAQTIVVGTGNANFTSAVIGRMLRLNGEAEDYKITAQNGANTLTVDRPIRSRMRGTGTTNIGAGYAAATCSWTIGPPGRFMIRFLPKPTSASTVKFRYMAYPRKLIETSDVSEIQEDLHHLIWKGALRAIGATKQNQDMYQMYAKEYGEALAVLKASDMDDEDSSEGPWCEVLGDDAPVGRIPGTYSRFGGGGRYGY